ncbi:MAG: hypothetical protein Q8J64_05700, partial [Thermodesulfovibrionales bacterium]|nr:hypothetical protein [Thermodesulfovibrionales bacterium]
FIWVTTGKATLYRGCNFEPSGRVEPLRLGEPSHRFELRGIEKSEYILPGRIVYFFCAVDFKSYKKRDICEHSGLIPVTLELSHRDHYYIQMSKLVPAYRVIAKKGVEPLLTYYLETLEKYKNSIKLYNNSNLSGFSRPLGCILQGYSAEQWFSRKALIQMNVPEDKIDALYKEYMGAK